MKKQKTLPQLPINLFWDVKVDKLDFYKNSDYIIARIFERGTDNHRAQILDFYGTEKVKNSLLNASYLRDDTISLCYELFSIQAKDFKCYEKKQSNKELWSF